MGGTDEPTDWQMKYIGEEQRHRTTNERLLKAMEAAEKWEQAYWALVKAFQAKVSR